jgi:hypothetical protein
MPRKPAPPPVIEQVIYNPDPVEGKAAMITCLQLLIDAILERRAALQETVRPPAA